jgi:hypothetical protein
VIGFDVAALGRELLARVHLEVANAHAADQVDGFVEREACETSTPGTRDASRAFCMAASSSVIFVGVVAGGFSRRPFLCDCERPSVNSSENDGE